MDRPFLSKSATGNREREIKEINVPFCYIKREDFKKPVRRVRVFWMGQSTVLVQFQKFNVIFDPVFSSRVGPLPFVGPKRLTDLPLRLEDLPPVHFVFISHDHYDHLDKKSLLILKERFDPYFFVPKGLKKLLSSWGIKKVDEFEGWEGGKVRGLKFTSVPGKHFSGRGPLSFGKRLCSGWFVESLEDGVKVYFAGDTAYGPFFEEIFLRMGPPFIAILPVGSYEPRWFMKERHMNPMEAILAFKSLRAEYMLAVHWGTFIQSTEPILEPVDLTLREAEAQGLAPDRVIILPVGGRMDF